MKEQYKQIKHVVLNATKVNEPWLNFLYPVDKTAKDLKDEQTYKLFIEGRL